MISGPGLYLLYMIGVKEPSLSSSRHNMPVGDRAGLPRLSFLGPCSIRSASLCCLGKARRLLSLVLKLVRSWVNFPTCYRWPGVEGRASFPCQCHHVLDKGARTSSPALLLTKSALSCCPETCSLLCYSWWVIGPVLPHVVAREGQIKLHALLSSWSSVVIGAIDINTDHSCSRVTSVDMALGGSSSGRDITMTLGSKLATNLPRVEIPRLVCGSLSPIQSYRHWGGSCLLF